MWVSEQMKPVPPFWSLLQFSWNITISLHSWLLSHHCSAPKMNNASLSFQFTAHLSLLPNYYTLLWSVSFSLFHIHLCLANAISLYPSLDKQTLMCHSPRALTMPPWVTYGRRSVPWLRMWKSQFIRMLLWCESDGCHSLRCHKTLHLMAMKYPSNSLEIGVGWAGLHFYAYIYLFILDFF